MPTEPRETSDEFFSNNYWKLSGSEFGSLDELLADYD